MLKAYAIGFVGAVLAIALAIVIAGAVRPAEEPGLRWGGTVYSSKQEFQGYLKSKGLSYEAWLARYPNAAPWESAPERRRATRAVAAAEPQAASPSSGARASRELPSWLPLAAISLALAGGAVLLLTRGAPRFATARIQLRPVIAFERRPLRFDALVAGGRAALPPLRRLALAAADATRRFESSVPFYGDRVLDAVRRDAQPLGKLVHGRNIRAGDVVFAVLALMATLMFVLFVVVLLTA